MLEAPARVGVRDEDIGLGAHLTTTPGLGGRLKVRIEDFHVDEVGPAPPPDPAGRFTAARVRLTNWETNRFVHEASALLGVSRKKIHFSGTKDKRGVTTQWFTVEAAPEQVSAWSRLPGVEVLDAYPTVRELTLGSHRANAFRIVLRDLPGPLEAVQARLEATAAQLAAAGGAPNFFGPQRFGTRRATTHRVGERMLRGDFLGAVQVYLAAPHPAEASVAADERARLAMEHDWKVLLARMDGDRGFERAMLHRLVETGDPLRALLALPENLQWLFVYAFQSFLFNQILSERLRRGLPIHRAVDGDLVAPVENGEVQEDWVPVRTQNLDRVNVEMARGRAVVTGLLPGTEVPSAGGAMGAIEASVLAAAGVAPRDFLVPEHLPWSSKGTRRALIVPVRGFEGAVAPDGLHPGRLQAEFGFELPKGAYATTVLREFMKSPWQDDYA